MQGFIKKQFPDLKPGEDYNFFGFPTINKKYAKAIEAPGDVCIAFGLSPNRSVAIDDYPDVLSKTAATILKDAKTIVFDASDSMPSAVNNAFWGATLNYVQNPGKLDSILEELDRVSKESY